MKKFLFITCLLFAYISLASLTYTKLSHAKVKPLRKIPEKLEKSVLKAPRLPTPLSPKVSVAVMDFKNIYGPGVFVTKSTVTGAILKLSGFQARIEGETPKDIALAFLQKNNKLFLIDTNLSDLQHVRTSENPFFWVVRFEQRVGGTIPVYGAEVWVYLNKGKQVERVRNTYIPGIRPVNFQKISGKEAIQIAKEELEIKGKLREAPTAKLVILFIVLVCAIKVHTYF